MNDAFKELDSVFDSIIDEIENPGRSYGTTDIFRNLHGEKTEYADYAKVVYTIVVRVADDNMSATINVVSTADKIRRYTIGELNRAIRAKGVVYGIDSEALMRMVSKQTFNRDVVFAKGSTPENGKDGYLEHLISFPDGKNTLNVEKGEPLCKVIPPTSGIHGSDVFGKLIPAVGGAPFTKITEGVNTEFDKKTGILSACAGGNLSLKNGVYSICDEYALNCNVTKENGKIEFAGTIIINGNVSSEAVIVAGKNVIVKGKVTNSSITAGKDITIEYALKNSTLFAEGDISLMNCTDSEITCMGDITAASFANCNVNCTGNLDCTVNQGSITGGTINCIGKLSCITAGSRLHEITEITIGDCSNYIAERVFLLRSLNRIESDIEKITKRIDTLELQKKDLGFLSIEDKDFLVAAKRIKKQKEADKLPVKEKIAEIEKLIDRSNESVFKAQRSVHANVILKMKDYRREFDAEFGKVTAFVNDFGIVLS